VLTVGSLFAGIGGFDLAAERAGLRVKWQVEIDPFCQRVLAKHWPDVKRYGDIRRVRYPSRVDIICGGFPCQDISFAGSGAGLAGARSGLWRPMVRTIRVVRPRYAVLENVAALLARGMGEVLGDLAGVGYDAEWDCLPACAFGHTHVRQRLFAVAYPDSFDGRPWLRDSPARTVWPVQEIDGFTSARARAIARLADPSELYRGADGVPDRPHRNRAIGNSIVPAAAEWIFKRIIEAEKERVA
jgi:DNA (cytosine-5)-methyltransferase 1